MFPTWEEWAARGLWSPTRRRRELPALRSATVERSSGREGKIKAFSDTGKLRELAMSKRTCSRRNALETEGQGQQQEAWSLRTAGRAPNVGTAG